MTTIISHKVSYPLTLEKEYIVMGMVIYKDTNCMYYLVDEWGLPNWLPYMLFEISHKELTSNWFVNMYDKKEPIGYLFWLCGFNELCNNDDYHDALLEREPEALKIYFERKYEAQEWYFERG